MKDIKKSLDVVDFVPNEDRIFAFLKGTTPESIRAIIIGQDPYQRSQEAIGIAFSVPKRLGYITQSVKNIHKELELEYGSKFQDPRHASLRRWRSQQVLLINSALTVPPYGRYHDPNDIRNKKHYDIWFSLIVTLLNYLTKMHNKMIIMMWGHIAKRFEDEIEKKPSFLYLFAPHPVNREGKFLGNGNFKAADEYMGKRKVNWCDL
ncbi:uracil-DNA glycosylase-like protein [Blyttiomyces helicus]|uniref:Uracil-DNA glycosylase-like protein n=2 Tax=Fungi incertae sedis TaxID=112252 RepID=A0A4P9VZH4_9FUNG|nr:uracil-DNA glycosylase-like protein [Blyttiomyces helicus]|eukprot:RKO84193.1 uracil-DNA glycosylase-like protein [Blyttiomyces helicus]